MRAPEAALSRRAVGLLSSTNSIIAVQSVLRLQPYRYLGAGLFAIALPVYLFTLPATYTGGAAELISLRYLNIELLFFSFVLAALLSLALTNSNYATSNFRIEPW